MKSFRTVLMSLLILILLAIIAGSVYIRYISKMSLPDYNRDITLSSLTSEVKVIRDSFAIPHIFGSTEQDVYRATGYLMAQDRLWQMDLLRRLTTGRLSEIFGKDLVNADLLFRSLRFTEKSYQVLDSCNAEVISCLQAFSEGVNQYIRDFDDKLPPEFTILGYKPEPWEPVHSANLIGYMAWGLTTAWQTEVVIYKVAMKVGEEHAKDLIPDMNLQDQYIHQMGSLPENAAFIQNMDDAREAVRNLGLQVLQASNNWAVSGKKSKTGKPILANDMHLELNSPGIWYQIHQQVPGKLDVTGVSLPGQPFVICGHNNKIAWGMTNVMLDDMDFYVESLSPADTGLYRFDGKWLPIEVRKEIILTKEGDTLTRYNRFTHRGPVISSFKGFNDKVISMKWTGNDFSNEILSVYLFNRAQNWEEFRHAAKTFLAISQNIVYADTEGNIGMQTAAGIPVRNGNPVLFAPGDTSLFDWTGLVPFEELPFTYNPACGYVASANNRTIGDQYPYYISSWFDLPNRYIAIIKGLERYEKSGIEEFIKIQSDQNSVYAAKLVPVLLKALENNRSDFSSAESGAYELLLNWKYTMSPEDPASSIFEQTYLELTKGIFEDETGKELYPKLIEQDMLPTYLIDALASGKQSIWTDNITSSDRKETFEDNLSGAFRNAVKILSDTYGEDPSAWKWGEMHTLTLMHPLGKVNVLNRAFKLNKGPYPVGGSYHTVSPYSYPFEMPFLSNHGSSHRHIFSTDNWDQSLTIIPTGQSGIPSSPFYCNQTEMYVNYRYHADPFTMENVEKHKGFEMRFLP